MRATTLRALTAALFLGSVGTAGSAATVMIDEFSGVSQIVTAPSLTPPNSNPDFQFAAAPTALGGQRGIGASRTSPTGTDIGPGLITLGFSDGGVGGVSNAPGANGFATFFWDGGGADLVDGTNTRITIDVAQVTAPTGPTLATFALEIGGVSVSRLVSGAGQIEFGFDEFGGADFTSIGSVMLLVTGVSGFGTTFDNVQAVGSPAPVPLPAAGLLLLGSIGALFGLRRRRDAVN